MTTTKKALPSNSGTKKAAKPKSATPKKPKDDDVQANGLTIKQESFCYAYVENGGNASEAYRTAYDAGNMQDDSIYVAASRLLSNAKVALRVKELREAIADAHKLTVADLIKELEENRTAALTAETVQASAATAATMGKARLLGLDKQKVEHDIPPESMLASLLKSVAGTSITPIAKPEGE